MIEKRIIPTLFTIFSLMSFILCNNDTKAMLEEEEEVGADTSLSRERSPVRMERNRRSSDSTDEDTSKGINIFLESRMCSQPPHEKQYDSSSELEMDIARDIYEADINHLNTVIKTLALENAALRKKLDESNKYCSCFYKAKIAFLKFWGFK